MNSNRSQYTSAPTYGIRNKGFAKKLGFTQENDPLVPDFDAYPAQNTRNAPAQEPNFSAQKATAPDFSTPTEQYIPYAAPPTQAQNNGSATQQGVPYGYGAPAAGYNPYGYGQMPQQNPYGYGQMPQQNPYGYTQMPQQQNPYGYTQNPQQQNSYGYTQNPQQQNPYGYTQNPQQQNPYGYTQMPGQQNPYGYTQTPQQQNPYVNAPQAAYPQTAATQPYTSGQSEPAPGPTPKQAKPASPTPQQVQPSGPYPQNQPEPTKRKMSSTQLLSLFLYGILPLLFIISCFNTPVFYGFIALSLATVGILWYMDLYAKPVRLIVSGLFAVLCIIGVVMIIRKPAASTTQITNVQASNGQVVVTVPPDLLATEEPDLLATEIPLTPAPTAAISNAERRLSAFMDLWQTNNAEAMVALVMPSWVNKQADAALSLFNLLANRTAKSYKIESITGTESDTSRAITMTASIDKNNGKGESTYRFTVMMVKEGDEWYVNPNSLATNDQVDSSEDETVVNDSKAKGLATEPPRTTVTPVPPGSTLLYYNPDGGSYYHSDPNCASIRSEFLPLKGSFTYAELGEYRKTLTPCMKCNAPSNTLPPDTAQ